jgi:hypothetical protein
MKQFLRKSIALTTSVSLLTQQILTTASFANGPSQPEFSNFESVETSGMVNEFNGGFTYNLPVLDIPGIDGGGYAVSLSYHSGVTPDEDASWVGYGWTLNPGAIVRNKRGFADDVKDGLVNRYNSNSESASIPDNFTLSVGANISGNLEAYGVSLAGGVSNTYQYNNRTGFSTVTTPYVNCSAYGVSAGYQYDSDGGGFDFGFSPVEFIKGIARAINTSKEKTKAKEQSGKANGVAKSYAYGYAGSIVKGFSSKYQSYTLQDNCFPSINQSFTGNSYSVTIGLQGEPVCTPISVGIAGEVFGSFSYQNFDDASSVGATIYEGFMYSHEAYENEDAVMDYWVEKDSPYNIRDQYLGIPYANSDMFTVMGEGIGGTFKPYSKYVGYFRPNKMESHVDMYDIGVDIMLGLDNGGGGRLGFLGLIDDAKAVISSEPDDASIPIKSGANTLTLQGWDDCGYAYASDLDESYYMSFIGDMGGSADFNNEDAQAATLSGGSQVEGFREYTPSLPSSLDKIVNTTHAQDETERITRSSYIGFHTLKEMNEWDATANFTKRYNRNYEIDLMAKRNTKIPGETVIRGSTMTQATSTENDEEYDYKLNQIAEFCITNKNENKYVYALPVYVTRESNFSFDAKDAENEDGLAYSNTDNIVYKNTSSTTKKIGESSTYPYATSWLLTQINSPNYIDRTMDGPSEDDFGGYIKFGYTKGDGDSDYDEDDEDGDDVVNYRFPYRGLFNNPGSLSDPNDDMVSYSCGERENYYLYTIETKSHIAVFTISGRADGLDAFSDEDAASNNRTAIGTAKFKKLDRIDLYVKETYDETASDNVPVKSVIFDYDYSLQEGIPNFDSSDDPDYVSGDGTGKLTLKRVWFEYGGIVNAGISPYQFSYTYPTSYPSPYSSLAQSSSLDQNPDYNVANADAWGAYREDGEDRNSELKTWINQNQTSATFDPAAWHLKRITLPTGGSIDVQYEQHEYAYVQDRKAMAMVSLSTTPDITGNTGDEFLLNLSDDLGYNYTSESDAQDFINMLQRKFVDGEDGNQPEKIYFKLLYALTGSSTSLDDCNVEYITGYANVYEVGWNSTYNKVYVKLGKSISDADEIPREVCLDYYKTNRQGSIYTTCGGSSPFESTTSTEVATLLLSLLTTGSDFISTLTSECSSLDESHSYLRVPILDAKKGGGVRVKRLLMYDPGIETSDAGLYGSEYVYLNTDESSSGVATNEPSLIQEENALVTYLDKRTDQDWAQKIIAGNDKDQFEGPIGSGVLPGASVGYSRIVIKNIHDGITNNGFAVKEFLTAKDYPFDYDKYAYKDADGIEQKYEGVEITNITKQIDDPWALNLLSPVVTFKTWSTQGSRFYINNMHGQPKSVATYSGDYTYIHDVEKVNCSSSEEYTYYEPGEPVKVVRNWEWNEAGNPYEWSVPGKQTEVVSESKMICDSTITASLEIDFSVGICGPAPVPYPTVIPYASLNISKLRSYSTSKVINLPSLLKSVRSMHDGMSFITTNEYFDARTGTPIVTSKNDAFNKLHLAGSTEEHNGIYMNYSFPASHYYSDLQQASLTAQADFGATDDCSITKSGSNLTVLGSDACGCVKFFTPGDLIGIYGLTGGTEVWNVKSIHGSYIELSANTNFYYDNASSGEVTVNILESGKENLLSANIGSITSYGGEPSVSNLGLEGDAHLKRSCVSAALQSVLTTLTTYPLSSTVETLNCSDITIIDNNGDCSDLKSMGFTYQLYRPTENELQVLLNANCVSTVTYNAAYTFFISTTTGELMYGDASNEECAFGFGECLDFCPDPYTKLTGIVAASATELSDEWSLADRTDIYNLYDFSGENNYEQGAKGHWNSKSAYGYKTTISDITETDAHVWNTGVFDDFTVFNWTSTYNNSSLEWISADTITVCSPASNTLESHNALGLNSVGKFSNEYNLPYLVASNTTYENVMFEGFENAINDGTSINGEDGFEISTLTYANQLVTDVAHSGSNSLQLGFVSSGTFSTTHSSETNLQPITIDDQIKENGITVKFWVKESGTTTNDVTPYLNVSAYGLSQECTKVARVGEWILFQASLNSFSSYTTGNSFTPSIYFTYSSLFTYFSNTITIYIDDIKLHPSNAQTMAYVYDQNYFRILAMFDDQNFGMFYQYDAEGKLTRKIIETLNGIKTVSETEYNVPTTSR